MKILIPNGPGVTAARKLRCRPGPEPGPADGCPETAGRRPAAAVSARQQPGPMADAANDAGFGGDRLEAHLGQSRIAQRLQPELWCRRALRPDAEAVAGQVLHDAPPSADSLGGESGHLLAQDRTVPAAPAAAEHHVGDDQPAAGAQPPHRPRDQRAFVSIGQVVQRVAADDEIGVGRGKPEVLQVRHLSRYVGQPRIGRPLGQSLGHRGRDVDGEHRSHPRGQRHRHEPGSGTEVHADISRLRPRQNKNAVKHFLECRGRGHVIMPLPDALIPLPAHCHH